MNKSFKKFFTLFSLNILFSSNQPILNAMHESTINDIKVKQDEKTDIQLKDFCAGVKNLKFFQSNTTRGKACKFNEDKYAETSVNSNKNISNEKEKDKLLNAFYADIKRFGLPMPEGCITIWTNDPSDGHITLVITLLPHQYKTMYFKRIDPKYELDKECIKKDIKKKYGLINFCYEFCNGIDKYDNIEFCGWFAINHTKGVVWPDQELRRLGERLNKNNILPKLKKKFEKILKNPQLKSQFLTKLYINYNKIDNSDMFVDDSFNSVCNDLGLFI